MKLLETLKQKVLVSDGAMGTQLMAAGLPSGACGDLWNITEPEKVIAIQKRYVDAGSDCLITNTFGANGLSLARHGHEDKILDINKAAVKIAREAFGDKPGFVLGDVGPVGQVLEPFGDLSVDRLRDAVSRQIEGLMEGEPDAIIVETQSDLAETIVGIEAAKSLGAPCIIASMSYNCGPDGCSFMTMMGVSPEDAAAQLAEAGADIIAMNCGTGVDMALAKKVIEAYKGHADKFFMAQPNAGIPTIKDGKTIYEQTPEKMADSVLDLLRAGANIVGGCCGSTPDHIRAIRAKVDEWNLSLVSG